MMFESSSPRTAIGRSHCFRNISRRPLRRPNVFPIDMPLLRQRKEDIPMLVEYFVKRYADKIRKQMTKIN